MAPYYEQDGITIYHGDCREVLPSVGPVDLVLTDPPYGIGYNHGGRPGQRRDSLRRSPVIGDKADCWLGFTDSPSIIWGGHCFANRLPRSRAWLVWDKLVGTPPCHQGDADLAWTNLDSVVRLKAHRWRGRARGKESFQHYHPTQKPVALMEWCLLLTNYDTVCDPYMGSGSVLVAAKDLGRRAIGIEIEEKYCEIAAERLRQGVLFT